MKNRGSKTYQRQVDPYEEYTSTSNASSYSKGSDDECTKLTFETILQDINSSQLEKVKEKDKLPIVLNSKNKLNVYNKDGKICSAIIDPNMEKLVNCINKGNSFVAIVKSKRDETCIVKIQIA